MEALISFKDFTFKYDLQKNPTLKKINLEIFSSAQKSKTIHFCDNFQISLHAVITCTVIYLYNKVTIF